MARRMADLSPVYRVLSVEFAQATDAAFRGERSPAGEGWPALAGSTVERRIAKLAGANRRTKKTIAEKSGLVRGKLTKTALAKRDHARLQYAHGGGNIKMLIDSGRMRQSVRYVPRGTGIELSAVAYIVHHMGGSLKVKNRPPKRNPLVVQFTADGNSIALIPSAHERFLRAAAAYVATGTVPER
jgi:hypothetical protein